MHPLQQAFDKFLARLEQLYGSNHTHDFQVELDLVEEEIAKAISAIEALNAVKEEAKPAKK